MNDLQPEIRVALTALADVLARVRWMVGEELGGSSTLYDVLDRVEVLPSRILDGEVEMFFAEVAALAQRYPQFLAAWNEARANRASERATAIGG